VVGGDVQLAERVKLPPVVTEAADPWVGEVFSVMEPLIGERPAPRGLAYFTGALVGLGIPEIEAKAYEGKIAAGSVLVSVHVNNGDERDVAKRIFERARASDVVTVGEESVR
ncbi:MAG: hypothetical protein M3020_23675, partial [Myxococcota bacterium]|nr:hypothetical protein [Myxococcota bacterium]